MAGAFVVEAVGGGETGPIGVSATAHQGGHTMPVQRPCLAEIDKTQHQLLTCRPETENHCHALPPPSSCTLNNSNDCSAHVCLSKIRKVQRRLWACTSSYQHEC